MTFYLTGELKAVASSVPVVVVAMKHRIMNRMTVSSLIIPFLVPLPVFVSVKYLYYSM
jgi:hypothetical protein